MRWFLLLRKLSDACFQESELVKEYQSQLNSKFTGTADTVKAFVVLVNAFREATKEEILSILNDEKNTDVM